MNRTFKTFLLWLLIAALPVQGIAAALKTSCGPNHHASLAMATPAMVIQQSHDHHGSDSHHAHHHDQAMSDQGNDVDTTHADKNTTYKNSFCSACSACCAGAITQSELRFTPLPFDGETLVIPPIPSFTGFIPAALERPPRHHSA